jgi:hypothetical protein
VAFGADRGAGTAASLAGLGLVTGLWQEKTAGWLIGAGAVLGAIWGGIAGAEDPGLRIRVQAGPRDPEADRRRPVPQGAE